MDLTNSESPHDFCDLDIFVGKSPHELPYDVSLLVASYGFSAVQKKNHLTVEHFECLMNSHNRPILNEIVKLKPGTPHLLQLPLEPQQIFRIAVYIMEIPSSCHRLSLSLLNDEKSLALYDLDQMS